MTLKNTIVALVPLRFKGCIQDVWVGSAVAAAALTMVVGFTAGGWVTFSNMKDPLNGAAQLCASQLVAVELPVMDSET